MSEYLDLTAISVPAQRILGDRPNMTELLGEIGNDSTELNMLFESFDGAIETYNDFISESLPEELIHIPKAKLVFDQIPSIRSMLIYPKSGTCLSFVRTLYDMDPLMQRAEEKKPEPFIGFHVWEGATSRERLVGGIFQVYGMTIVNRVFLGHNNYTLPEHKHTLKDTLLDALIETMVLNQADGSFDPILEVVRTLGWLEAKSNGSTYLFSDSIRSMATVALK